MGPGQTLLGQGELLDPAQVLSAASIDPRFPVTSIQHLIPSSGAWLLPWQDLEAKDQKMVNRRPV